jgi:hypothetical protein
MLVFLSRRKVGENEAQKRAGEDASLRPFLLMSYFWDNPSSD